MCCRNGGYVSVAKMGYVSLAEMGGMCCRKGSEGYVSVAEMGGMCQM